MFISFFEINSAGVSEMQGTFFLRGYAAVIGGGRRFTPDSAGNESELFVIMTT